MSDRAPPSDQEFTVPVVEERLALGRRTVETGRVLRLRKEVQEEPADVEQVLAHDVIETRRVSVNRVLDAPVSIRHEGDVTVIPVVEERLVTRKELVLVEEIHVRRRSELRSEHSQVSLRRETVRVERFDPDTQQWLPEEGAELPSEMEKKNA